MKKNNFIDKCSNLSNGFSIKIGLENSGAYSIKYFGHDEFSIDYYEDDYRLIVVQAGIRSSKSLNAILNDIINDNAFPKRDIEGSFVIFDKRKKVLILGRDRSQVYHLYMYKSKENIYISTNLNAFIGSVCNEFDTVGVSILLATGISAGPFSIYKDLFVFLPGQYCSFRLKEQYNNLIFNPKTFWQIKKTIVPSNYEEATLCYGLIIEDEIKKYVKDGNAGLFLSGGSDSATVLGILDKLGCKTLAGHMDVGHLPIDLKLVDKLKDNYKFILKLIKPDRQNLNKLKDDLDYAISENLQGSYPSVMLYKKMGEMLGSLLPKETTVFNGELCLLDVGFTESSDFTRSIRRWLYLKQGRKILSTVPIFPSFLSSIDKRISTKWSKGRAIISALISFLYSFGRIGHYFGGIKLGFKGFPGIWQAQLNRYLQNDVNFSQLLYDRFFCNYVKRLNSEEWKQALNTMIVHWYSEASNLTMPLVAAFSGKQSMCFPFSSVKLMDFISSLPLNWTIDKKIQKDLCYNILKMNQQVSYYLKNHKVTGRDYLEILYGNIFDKMIEQIYYTDFGVFDKYIKERILLVINGKKSFRYSEFNFYVLSVYKTVMKD